MKLHQYIKRNINQKLKNAWVKIIVHVFINECTDGGLWFCKNYVDGSKELDVATSERFYSKAAAPEMISISSLVMTACLVL